MRSYVLFRLFSLPLLLLLYLTFLFFILHSGPIDAARARLFLREDVTRPLKNEKHAYENEKKKLGLDRPLFYFIYKYSDTSIIENIQWNGAQNQYHYFIVRAIRLDFGNSYIYDSPAKEIALEAFRRTLVLAFPAAILSIFCGVYIGAKIATLKKIKYRRFINGALYILNILPPVWTGFVVLATATWAGISFLAPFDAKNGTFLTLSGVIQLLPPIFSLIFIHFVYWALYFKEQITEALATDYIQTARAQGFSDYRVLYKHVLYSILSPSFPLMLQFFLALLNGSIIIERLFNIPGLGETAYQAALARDYPLLTCILAILGALGMAGFLFSDLLSYKANPKLSLYK